MTVKDLPQVRTCRKPTNGMLEALYGIGPFLLMNLKGSTQSISIKNEIRVITKGQPENKCKTCKT